MTKRYYNRKGEPISLMEWTVLLDDKDYRTIKADTLEGGLFVCTLWFGVGHKDKDGSPLIISTMVFKDSKEADIDCRLYKNDEKALVGHDEMVRELRYLSKKT
jgi:hypothetical protein